MLKMIDKMIDTKLNEDMFRECDIDEMLDLRDIDEFEAEWIKVYDKFNECLDESSYDKDFLYNIRKRAFLRAYEISQSGEIAACISDDFELIFKAAVLNTEEGFINSLAEYYCNSEFPYGVLRKSSKSLKEIIEN